MPTRIDDPAEPTERRIRTYLHGLTDAQIPTTNGYINLFLQDVNNGWAECPHCGHELSMTNVGPPSSDHSHHLISRVKDDFDGFESVDMLCGNGATTRFTLVYTLGTVCKYVSLRTEDVNEYEIASRGAWGDTAPLPFKDVENANTAFLKWVLRNYLRVGLSPLRYYTRLNVNFYLKYSRKNSLVTQASSQPYCAFRNTSLLTRTVGHKVNNILIANNAAIITLSHVNNPDERETLLYTPYMFSHWTTIMSEVAAEVGSFERAAATTEYVSESVIGAFLSNALNTADDLSESEMADKASKEDKGITKLPSSIPKLKKPTKNELVMGVETELKKVSRVAWLMRKDKGYVADKDYSDYLSAHLQIGMELELDFKENTVIDGDDLKKEFGVRPTAYHILDACPICDSDHCYVHIPPNLIRAAERDGSVNGWEFIIYGSTLSSEEFAKRLPLTKLQKYFRITTRDSCHAHALIANQKQPISLSVMRNAWQLYRFYYPAWAWLVGNTYEFVLRPSSYSGFRKFDVSAVEGDFVDEMSAVPRDGGMYFGNMGWGDEKQIQEFHVEIRTADASLDLEQLVVIRAMTKALFVRAAQLSNFGTIYVSYGDDKGLWKEVREAIKELNDGGKMTDVRMNFMRTHAMRLFKEFAPLLSAYERQCFLGLIALPSRDRPTGYYKNAIVEPMPLSEVAIALKAELVSRPLEVPTPKAWITKYSDLLGRSEDEIEIALSEIKAVWDDDLDTYVINGGAL